MAPVTGTTPGRLQVGGRGVYPQEPAEIAFGALDDSGFKDQVWDPKLAAVDATRFLSVAATGGRAWHEGEDVGRRMVVEEWTLVRSSRTVNKDRRTILTHAYTEGGLSGPVGLVALGDGWFVYVGRGYIGDYSSHYGLIADLLELTSAGPISRDRKLLVATWTTSSTGVEYVSPTVSDLDGGRAAVAFFTASSSNLHLVTAVLGRSGSTLTVELASYHDVHPTSTAVAQLGVARADYGIALTWVSKATSGNPILNLASQVAGTISAPEAVWDSGLSAHTAHPGAGFAYTGKLAVTGDLGVTFIQLSASSRTDVYEARLLLDQESATVTKVMESAPGWGGQSLVKQHPAGVLALTPAAGRWSWHDGPAQAPLPHIGDIQLGDGPRWFSMDLAALGDLGVLALAVGPEPHWTFVPVVVELTSAPPSVIAGRFRAQSVRFR